MLPLFTPITAQEANYFFLSGTKFSRMSDTVKSPFPCVSSLVSFPGCYPCLRKILDIQEACPLSCQEVKVIPEKSDNITKK